MTEDNKVFAVQMVEFNPQIGNVRKGITVSGVGSFRAGMAARGATFVPSPIVPIKDPTRMVKVGEREIALFDLLTGIDPDAPGTYYLSQPRKPNLPVFRRITAVSMEELQAAVQKQAVDAAQKGKPTVPAPIVGVRGAMEKAKEPVVKTVEQILEEGRNATGPETADAPVESSDTSVFDCRALVEKVNSRVMTSKNGRTELESNKDKVSAEDLAYIAEHGATLLREWANRETDLRVAKSE